MLLNRIVHESESKRFFIVREGKGFEVYENGVTAATRVASIGFEGQRGLDRALAEIAKREGAES